jgi:multidrug efflux pump
VTLVGLITKHGILIVEFANQLRAQGRERVPAVIESAVLRLRPILMTTGAMVLGTFFTLFVVPTVYSYLSGNHVAEDDADAVAVADE